MPCKNGEKMKTIAAGEFKAKCLRVIGQMCKDHEPVTITRYGHPVAILSPAPQVNSTVSIIGAMRGSVLSYDDPFMPATDPNDWTENR